MLLPYIQQSAVLASSHSSSFLHLVSVVAHHLSRSAMRPSSLKPSLSVIKNSYLTPIPRIGCRAFRLTECFQTISTLARSLYTQPLFPTSTILSILSSPWQQRYIVSYTWRHRIGDLWNSSSTPFTLVRDQWTITLLVRTMSKLMVSFERQE